MTRLIVIFFFGKKAIYFFFFEVLTSVLQACYPCPSYGNNNHPSLCHRKWRQLCFLPTRLIYGLLATLDHWHPQHWQPNWHHQDHHEHDEHCDRPSVETANCSGRCNCDFTLFSIFKLNLKNWSQLSWHVHEVRKCIKVGGLRDFAPMVNLYQG